MRSETKKGVKMIKTVKKEFDCSICEQPNIDLAVIESKNAEKEICWNCAFAQKRFNQYSKVGKEELIYS
jgi:transcription elongation factor Elf1